MSDIIQHEERVQISIFSSIESFEAGQRMAKGLCSSDLVPKEYKDNIPNTMIALELAHRIGISPFMVMQNLDIIHGKPSWRSTFIIAALNSCGRFKPLRFQFIGERGQENYGCYAITEDMDGNELKGTVVDWKMVKAEGWLTKAGSKWKTMPQQMFQYRAASFFGRLYAPDILNGMHSVDEVREFTRVNDSDLMLEEIKVLFDEKRDKLDEMDIEHFKRIIDTKEIASYKKCLRTLKEL